MALPYCLPVGTIRRADCSLSAARTHNYCYGPLAAVAGCLLSCWLVRALLPPLYAARLLVAWFVYCLTVVVTVYLGVSWSCFDACSIVYCSNTPQATMSGMFAITLHVSAIRVLLLCRAATLLLHCQVAGAGWVGRHRVTARGSAARIAPSVDGHSSHAPSADGPPLSPHGHHGQHGGLETSYWRFHGAY